MAGSYGAEATQGERYRLSFTVGGLLASQGRALAEMYLNHLNHAGGGDAERSPQTEVGKSIVAIRQQAIEENVLAIRTDSANRRVVAETTRRLSALTVGELAYLAGPDSSTSDREALMWIAMCRYYAIVGEFAGEVLKKHYLTGNTHLDFGTWVEVAGLTGIEDVAGSGYDDLIYGTTSANHLSGFGGDDNLFVSECR